jgi:hypothetical protein
LILTLSGEGVFNSFLGGWEGKKWVTSANPSGRFHPNMFPQSIFTGGKWHTPDFSHIPMITCSKHPIITRKKSGSLIKTLVTTDDLVLLVETPRGYQRISDYSDSFGKYASPTGSENLSWNARRNQITIAAKSGLSEVFPTIENTPIAHYIHNPDMRRIVKPAPYWLNTAENAHWDLRW